MTVPTVKVYDRMAEAFVAETPAPVFGLLSDWNVHWADALRRRGREVVEVRHEGAGLAMADGWARVSGEVGVCFAAGGPGLAQFATTILVAARARTPLVAFAGDGGAADVAHSQRFEHRRFAEAVEAGFVRLLSADQADTAVCEAFYRARLESRPIVFSAPADVQQDVVQEPGPYRRSRDLLPAGPGLPDPTELDRAVELVAASRRPVILAGRGAVDDDGAGRQVDELADRIGAIVATTLLAKNWLAESPYHAGISGLYSSATAMELLSQSDCVIAVGASLNNDTIAHGYLYPDASFVQIDVRPHVLMGGGTAADAYLHTGATVGLALLNQRLTERDHHAVGYRTDAVAQQLSAIDTDTRAFDLEPGTLDTRDVCRLLDAAMPPEVGMVLGGGHAVQIATMTCNRPRDLILANQHFGCIGQGLTTAIGASLADGRRPVFLVDGDAGLLMHGIEFETAVRCRVPVFVVVLNDQGLGAEFHRMSTAGLAGEMSAISTPDLGAMAVTLGGRGHLARSLTDVEKAVEEFVTDPVPTVLDVRISRNVMSLPYRRVLLGLDE
jgi:acetolactate synthase-1/2/3 large subunit